MQLRFIFLAIIASGLASCINLKPKPDNTKTFALGLSNLAEQPAGSNFNSIKGYIARPEFPVYMKGNEFKLLAEDGEILRLPNAYWAEPIDMGVARALGSYIETHNGSFRNDFYPWVRTDGTTFTLQVKFHQLIATDDGRILVSANWEYSYGADKTQTGFFENDMIEWSPGDPRSMVTGINKGLELLASEIVVALKKEALSAKGY